MINNHPILSLLVLTLTLPFLVSCTTAPPPDTTDEDRRAINAVSRQFVDTFNRGDAAANAALHTEEGKRIPPNSPIAAGREGIQASIQAALDAGVSNLQTTAIELSLSGDMAHEIGEYTLTIQPEEGEAMSDSGTYLVLLKRENGSWKIDIAIWNSSLPLFVPEAPSAPEEE